ncbi:MAG: hypothetical protein KatS3mg050_3927 [Litorilinea sp.]|nr:MAG: hypothetical protein KatS3mg050_3927 [Litorilinea sp.]
MAALREVFDVTLLATLGLIFFGTLVGAYLRSRRCDPCLKSFESFHVTLERVNGKIIWGVMELEPTGLELRYRNLVQDANHVESSYILYGEEYGEIQAIFRYVDDLAEESRARRQRDLERSFHPGPLRRLGRGVRHFFNIAGESLSEMIGVLVGRLRKPAGRYITETGEAHLKSLGSEVIGQVGHVHDPLLERYIGQKVVVELLEDDEVHEHVGIFKNYSADFLEFLDVQFPQRQALPLGSDLRADTPWVSATRKGNLIQVVNHTGQPVLLQSLALINEGEEDEEDLLNVVVDAGETLELHPSRDFAQANLYLRVVRELDMIVPRHRARIRHRAECQEPSILPEIIFDLGVILRRNSRLDHQETRLRAELAENPASALAASNLGAILAQKQRFAEARQWLEKAYAMRYSLPDNGRRTYMLLNEVRRRQAKANSATVLLAAHSTSTHQGHSVSVDGH